MTDIIKMSTVAGGKEGGNICSIVTTGITSGAADDFLGLELDVDKWIDGNNRNEVDKMFDLQIMVQ